MAAAFPFLTTYDPPGTGEGSLDPLGLYQIADQLAMQLVPAVRERMLRIRFLTAMAVGSLVIEDLEGDPRHRDATPYLVWEWLVVEALTREMGDDPSIRGVPGTGVAQVARAQHGYVDARSYLKTPSCLRIPWRLQASRGPSRIAGRPSGPGSERRAPRGRMGPRAGTQGCRRRKATHRALEGSGSPQSEPHSAANKCELEHIDVA